MRIAFSIVCLAAIGLTLVACRHEEVSTQHEIQRLQGRLVVQRRRLWDLDVRMGRLTSLQALDSRAETLHTRLLAPHQRMVGAWDEVYAAGSVEADRSWLADRRTLDGAR